MHPGSQEEANVKCFQGNFDGIRLGLVIASSQKNAAKIAGTSLYEFRMYWTDDAPCPKQKLKQGTLYTRTLYGDEEWFEGLCSLENKRRMK